MRRWALRGGAALAVVYLALLADWRREPAADPVLRRGTGSDGPLLAGAARAPLSLPLPVVMGGYGPRKAQADRVSDPLAARALVLRGGRAAAALVLLDLVLIPDELVGALEARLADLGLQALLVAATHTHSAAGGYHRRLLPQAVGMGRYRADVEARVLAAAEAAVREAEARVEPARVVAASARLAGWARNRSTPAGAVDDELTVLVLERTDGGRAALLAVTAAHPTVLDRRGTALSAEYPGAAMRRLEERGGTAFVLQGAAGDAALRGRGPGFMEEAGALLARRVDEAAAGAPVAEGGFAAAEATVALPRVEVAALRSWWWRRPASNVASPLLPSSARVAALRLGGVTLLAVPGEPTAEAGRRLEAQAVGPGWRGEARVVSLAQGYLGYIETPEAVRERRGEARRTWYGPGLLDRLGQGLRAAASGLSPAPRPPPP